MEKGAQWLDRNALAQHISVRVDELPRLQKAHKLPRPSYHLGPKSPRWRRDQVDSLFSGNAPEPAKPTARELTSQIVQDILKGRV